MANIPSLSSKVKVPPVTVILHWPQVACERCAGEVKEIGVRAYMCESCRSFSNGRTEHFSGTVVRLVDN